MTDSHKNRPSTVSSSQALLDQAADDEDIIILQKEVSSTEETDSDSRKISPPGDDADEEFLTLADELAVDAETDDGAGENQDEDIISLMDELSVDDEPDNEPEQSLDEDIFTLTDEIAFDAGPDAGPVESQDEDIISLTDQLSLDAETDDGPAASQDQDVISRVDEFSVDDETDDGLGQNQDEDVISLMDQPSVAEEQDKGLWENKEDHVVALSGDRAAEPADEVLELTGEPAGRADETSNMLNLVKKFAEPESKHKEIHNVTDAIDLDARKKAASLPREEILPLTDEPEQELILLDEDIDLKVNEITDDSAGEYSESSEPGAGGNVFDFGLNAAVADEHEAQENDGDSEVESAEIIRLDADDADDGLDSEAVLEEQILEVIEFDEDLAEVENPSAGQTDGKAESATAEGLLFEDDSAGDVFNVEDLEADSDDSEINNLIQDFFDDATPAADSAGALSETQPNQLESEIKFPDDFFDDDEFKFTFETKDISDKIDQLTGTSEERPAAAAPRIFPLGKDSAKPVKSPEDADFEAISEAKLDAAVQRVIERNFLTKIETMIAQAIEKAVSQEILKLKRLLLDKISGEDAE